MRPLAEDRTARADRVLDAIILDAILHVYGNPPPQGQAEPEGFEGCAVDEKAECCAGADTER
jgi:hypothetical protein